LLITSDEEGDAINGTVKVLEHLKNIDFLPTSAVVTEPTSENIMADAIKIGRRGSINGYLELKGKQGHAAYPQKAINPIDLISNILPKITGHDLDNGDEDFASSRFVITDMRSGIEATNVTPGVLYMMFNVRNSKKTSLEDIEKFIKKEFAGLDYKLELSQSAKPFVTDKNSKITLNLIKSINKILDKNPDLQTTGGTSDARFFGEFGIDTVEFGVVNNTIHAPNEYTHMEYVENLQRVFYDLIEFGDFN
jgi:succinyl-diaminopimelate desuccinylase